LAIQGLDFKNPQKDFSAGTYYIDVWATWCKPCIAKMKHNYRADSLLHANRIERIYISIDELNTRDGWLSTVHELQLGGYHILAGDHLKSSLYQRFGNGSNSMVIPRYLFMKVGKVVNAFAAHPDDLEGLEAQVRVINE
jgi:thiol-disulfide isomerase/thioredoxin